MTADRTLLQRLERESDEFAEVVVRALRRAVRAGTRGLGNVVVAQGAPEPAPEPPPTTAATISLDDLVAIEVAWRQELDQTIIPGLQQFMRAGADQALTDLAVEAPVLFNMRMPAAELHMAQAENRLRGVGTGLWQQTRDQLVTGMQEGESVPQLSRRVREVLASTEVRARTIARTEVISASNAGSIAQVRLLGDAMPVRKTWLATNDSRTRLTHRAADGQTVPTDDSFTVGGAQLDFPGDPTAPPDETINCRCTVTWVTADELPQSVAAAGAAEEHTGAMIALVPSDPEALALDDGEPARELHLTLFFMGEAADIPVSLQKAILAEVESRAQDVPVVEAQAFGAAVWNPNGESPCVVLNVSGDGLTDVRDTVRQGLVNAPDNVEDEHKDSYAWQLPEQHTPWSPHVCLAYDDSPTERVIESVERVGPVTFDRVRVALANEVHDFPLGGS